MIERFVFVVATTQREPTVSYYRDVLGGEVVERSGKMTLVQVGPGVVEVLDAERTTAAGMLALQVADVDVWHRRLLEVGAPVTYGPIDLDRGGRSLGSVDPNGVKVNLFTTP